MPTDIKYYQPFGGEKVTFEKEEVTEMKKFGEPGMSEQFKNTILLLELWEPALLSHAQSSPLIPAQYT